MIAELKDLSIVVLSYNRKAEVERNVEALCRLGRLHGFQLIVVDNASTDGSHAAIQELGFRFPDLLSILNSENVGAAEGRNLGWQRATGAFILSIDEDVEVDVGQMREMCTVMRDNPEVGVISPKIKDALSGRVLNNFGDRRRTLPTFYEGCHLVRRGAMEQVGYHDPRCFAAGEGFDYSVRMHAAGFSVLYVPEVVVIHRDRPRNTGENTQRRRLWVQTFSRLYFKHFPVRMATLFACRYLARHVLSGGRAFGIGYAATLPRWTLSGAREGWKQQRVVPAHTIAYYSNLDYPRDLGQQPLFRKLLSRISKRHA